MTSIGGERHECADGHTHTHINVTRQFRCKRKSYHQQGSRAGSIRHCRWQALQMLQVICVHKARLSVICVCDSGHRVMFEHDGRHWILPVRSRWRLKFGEDEKEYIVEADHPNVLMGPGAPTARENAEHSATRLPHRSWCGVSSRQVPRRDIAKVEKDDTDECNTCWRLSLTADSWQNRGVRRRRRPS